MYVRKIAPLPPRNLSNKFFSYIIYAALLFIAVCGDMYELICRSKEKQFGLRGCGKSAAIFFDCIVVVLGILQFGLYGNHVDNSIHYLNHSTISPREFLVQIVID